MNRIILFLTAFMMLSLPSVLVFPQDAFIIDHYRVEMNVRENNSYQIKEIIDLDFSAQRHGIIREIPLYFDDMPVKISNISVKDYEYRVEKGQDSVQVRIGSADSFVQGKVRYTLTYLYDVGADRLPDMDEFNHNLIGVQWDTIISNADFSITLPKEFNPKNVNCTSGPYGSTDNTGVEWKVEGTVITGRLTRPLNNFEGLTVALPLPQGYWVGAVRHHPPGYLFYTMLGFPLYILVVLLSFILWFAEGRDNQIFPTVQFESPEGLTPSEIGYIIDGQVNNKDVTSLIIYWAHKGYLAIDVDTDNRGRTRRLELVKLSEPGPKARSYEQYIFKKLFEFSKNDRISTSDLTNTFYKTVRWGADNIAKTFTNSKKRAVFSKGTDGYTFLTAIMAALPIIAILLEALQDIKEKGLQLLLVIVIPFLFVFCFKTISKAISTKSSGDKNTLVFATILGTVLTVTMGALSVLVWKIPLSKFLAAEAACFTGAFFSSIMSKRTQYGDRILEKVLGFKDFIKEAEKDKLEALFQSNPSYFYNILPYAMVLGLSDKWSSHFEDLAVEPPDWYRGRKYDRFNTRDFERDLRRDVTAIGDSMSSTPSSSGSSGSSSSGGFSGGGSGGGGGSSW